MTIIFFFSIVFLLFLILSTQTLWLHPRPRKDLLHKPFTQHSDLTLKKEGNRRLVVALHGMYSHPETFREFGERILPQGWDLYAPALPNSALSTEDLQSQEIYQWEELLQAAFHRVMSTTENYDKVVLLGHSQGGALSLTLAPTLGFLDGLMVVAAPLHMLPSSVPFWRYWGLRLSGFLHFFIPSHGMKVDSTPEEIKQSLAKIEDIRGGEGFFFGLTLHSMHLGLKKMRRRLHLISCPLFIAYEKQDRTVSFSDCLELKKKAAVSGECLTDTPPSLHPYSRRHRLFSYTPVKETLFTALEGFLKERE